MITRDQALKNYLTCSGYTLEECGTVEAFLTKYKDAPHFLQEFENILRSDIDAQFGITSYVRYTIEKGVQRSYWIRDAMHQDKNVSTTASRIEGNNTLLRCLTRVRGIAFAANERKLIDDDGIDIGKILLDKFVELYPLIIRIADSKSISEKNKIKEIEELEECFDNFLIQVLYNAGLAPGCNTKEDYTDLLFHYRNLASTVEKARPLITYNYHKDKQLLHKTLQLPVTNKRRRQKENITAFIEAEKNNIKTAKKPAISLANIIFEERLLDNATILPAQARKSLPDTGKNTFIVREELFLDISEKEISEKDISKKRKPNHVLWLVRSGSPVYVGQGATPEQLKAQTTENLGQIIDTVSLYRKDIEGEPQLFITCLLTDSRNEDQDTVVKTITAVADEFKNVFISHVPVNLQGASTQDAQITKELDTDDLDKSKTPGQKASRYNLATTVVAKASEQPNAISYFFCNSGQDRTGTVWLLTVRNFIFEKSGVFNTRQEAEDWLVSAGNAQDIASHSLPGSPGIKPDSTTKGPFDAHGALSTKTEKALHTHSAKHNKSNPISRLPRENVALSTYNILQKPPFYERHPVITGALLALGALVMLGIAGTIIYFTAGTATPAVAAVLAPIVTAVVTTVKAFGIAGAICTALGLGVATAAVGAAIGYVKSEYDLKQTIAARPPMPKIITYPDPTTPTTPAQSDEVKKNPAQSSERGNDYEKWRESKGKGKEKENTGNSHGHFAKSSRSTTSTTVVQQPANGPTLTK